MYTNDDLDAISLLWIVLAILFVVGIVAISGCASREVSSTDNHHRVPQVNCQEVKYEGHMHRICCEPEHCVFVD
jgi:hypothetical protein